MYQKIKETPRDTAHSCGGSSNLHQTRLDSVVMSTKKYGANDYRQVEITKAVVSYVAGDLLPLSTVESTNFRHLMKISNPKYQVPSRKHFTTKLLPQTMDATRAKLQQLLSKSQVVCVTVDLWSSRQMRSYFGMTAHFVVDWQLRSAMLSCTRFHGSHTGYAIADEFEKTIASFNLTKKISFTVSDSASNMMKAFSLPSFEVETENASDDDYDDEPDNPDPDGDAYTDLSSQHVPCFAHVLQLVIKDGFKQAPGIIKVLNRVSAIVSHVRKSTLSSEILESEKRLAAANATRWNSQLIMIRSILRLPTDKLESLNTVSLSAYDRTILEDLVEILTPFETATHCIQGDKVITSSMIVPCIRVLKSTVEDLSHKYTSRFVTTLKSSINKRLSMYEDIDEFLLASALDPRFKLKWCSSNECLRIKGLLVSKLHYESQPSTSASLMSHTQVIEKANEPAEPSSCPQPPPHKKMKTFFDDLLIADKVSSSSIVDANVDEYLQAPLLPQEENPLEFWKVNEMKYPTLAKLVPVHLCIPASSAPVERLFSIAGKVFRPDRCRLKDKTFEELMFIRCNQFL